MVLIEGAPRQLSSRVKRGFRNGAADRFSHGFGKRTEVDLDVPELLGEGEIMTVEEMADLVRSSPTLSYIFVKRFVDTDGDGSISRAELFSNKAEQ